MSSETKKVQIDVKKAERLLGQAMAALDSEDHKQAMAFVKDAEKARRQSLRRFTVALKALKKAQQAVEEAEQEGDMDLRLAEGHLKEARVAFKAGDYSRVVEEARFAMGKCLGDPKLGKDLILKTELEPEDDRHMIFTVKVGNLLKRSISEIPLSIVNLQPYLVNIDEGKETAIKELGPGVVKSYKFRLELADDSSDMGQYFLGRDIALSSTLNYRNAKLVSTIIVTNRSASTMVDLSVQPFLPQGYRPDKEMKEIDVLYPNETKTVVFSLHPEGEEPTPYPEFPEEEEETSDTEEDLRPRDTRESYSGIMGSGQTREEETHPQEPSSLTKEDEEESSLLEGRDSEFPDTEYDEELKDLENWSPTWKEEISAEDDDDFSWEADEDTQQDEAADETVPEEDETRSENTEERAVSSTGTGKTEGSDESDEENEGTAEEG